MNLLQLLNVYLYYRPPLSLLLSEGLTVITIIRILRYIFPFQWYRNNHCMWHNKQRAQAILYMPACRQNGWLLGSHADAWLINGVHYIWSDSKEKKKITLLDTPIRQYRKYCTSCLKSYTQVHKRLMWRLHVKHNLIKTICNQNWYRQSE